MSAEPVVVGVAVPVPDADLARIAAADPRVRVVHAPELQNAGGEAMTGERLERLRSEIADVEVLFAGTRTRREQLEEAKQLRWFHSAGAGVEGFAASGGLELDLTVTNSRGAGSGPIAEWIVGAIIALAKGFPMAVRNQQEGKWGRWGTQGLEGKTAGIVGMGAIGRDAAKRLRPFGVRIVSTRRSAQAGDTDPDSDLVLPQSELGPLLDQSDYVIVTVPLTEETRGLIGAAEIARMKPGAYLVNVARGAIVDHEAMTAALRDKRLAGAALDVTEPEPLPSDNELWRLPNVLITPHNSPSVGDYWTRSCNIFLRNLQHYLAGEPLENVVNRERGY